MLTSFLFVVEELQKKLKKDTEEFFLPPSRRNQRDKREYKRI